MQNGDFTYTEIPDFLYGLCEKAIETIQRRYQTSLPPASLFQNCIVSVYRPGCVLRPHIDLDKEQAIKNGKDFFFGEYIIGVVLKADTQGGLYLVNSTDPQEVKSGLLEPESVLETNGTVFLLSDESRRVGHGVSEIETSRISATFRIVFSQNSLLLRPKTNQTRKISPASSPHPPA